MNNFKNFFESEWFIFQESRGLRLEPMENDQIKALVKTIEPLLKSGEIENKSVSIGKISYFDRYQNKQSSIPVNVYYSTTQDRAGYHGVEMDSLENNIKGMFNSIPDFNDPDFHKKMDAFEKSQMAQNFNSAEKSININLNGAEDGNDIYRILTHEFLHEKDPKTKRPNNNKSDHSTPEGLRNYFTNPIEFDAWTGEMTNSIKEVAYRLAQGHKEQMPSTSGSWTAIPRGNTPINSALAYIQYVKDWLRSPALSAPLGIAQAVHIDGQRYSKVSDNVGIALSLYKDNKQLWRQFLTRMYHAIVEIEEKLNQAAQQQATQQKAASLR